MDKILATLAAVLALPFVLFIVAPAAMAASALYGVNVDPAAGNLAGFIVALFAAHNLDWGSI